MGVGCPRLHMALAARECETVHTGRRAIAVLYTRWSPRQRPGGATPEPKPRAKTGLAPGTANSHVTSRPWSSARCPGLALCAQPPWVWGLAPHRAHPGAFGDPQTRPHGQGYHVNC